MRTCYSWEVSYSRLRLRVLSVFGLPVLACAKQTPDGGGGPTVLEIPPVASATATSAAPDDAEDEELFTHAQARTFDCGRDRARTIVCGRTYRAPDAPMKAPYEQCSASPDVGREVVVGVDGGDLSFDSALTTRFRQHKGDDNNCCYSRCADVKALAEATTRPPNHQSHLVCLAAMPKGSRHPVAGKLECPAAVDFGSGPGGVYGAPFHEQNSAWRTNWVREATGFRELSLCCYDDVRPYRPVIRGRALRDERGQLLVADTCVARSSWSRGGDAGRDGALTGTERLELGARWTADAALEHASVAAFAQLSLSLLACGAPPELLVACHHAALDEIRHAELCYGLAARHTGEPLAPGALPAPAPPTTELVALACETLLDGCVGETTAALVARRGAESAVDPAVRRVLAVIADDEERHAELGWRILAWAASRPDAGGEVREALARELDALEREAAAAPTERAGLGPLATHGLLGADAEQRLRAEVITAVVLPCARALLGARA